MSPVRMTWLDRLVGYVDPVAAVRRLHARHSLALLGGNDSYHGADPRRRALRNWRPRASSADSATLPALTDLRANSRDLVRNNPLAGGAINTVTTSVVGTGLAVRPAILARRLRLSEEQAAAWQREAKELFELWADRAEWCDLGGRLTFYALQELAFRSALESGDTFVLLPMVSGGGPFETRVQLIEADRVCNPQGAGDDPDKWAGGILVDENGRPIKAAIADKHPGGVAYAGLNWREVEFIGAKTGRRNLLHLVTMLRPGQRRGVPYLAPVIEHIKQLGDYTNAEITAAVLNSFFTVFVKKVEQDGAPAPLGTAAAPAVPEGTKVGNEIGLGSGTVVDLADGEDVSFADPKRPNVSFDAFVTAILRQIGVGLELPFEVLVKHFTASYSAAQAALLDAWRFYTKRRQWLAAQFCQPVYEAVITECVLSGRLRAPGFLRDPLVRAAYLRAVWIGDGRGAIDGEKEARAAAERIRAGISDKAAEALAYSGRDWEDVHAQRVREYQAELRDGLAQSPAPAPAPSPAGNEDKPDTEEE